MAVPLLDLKAQHLTIRESVVNAMMKVVDDQSFILGEPVERLERDVAKLSQTTHAIGCANGTDAILLALRALNIGKGDAVYVLCDGRRRPQCRGTSGVCGHRSRHLQSLR